MIVDAHAHVWTLDPERYPWRPTFGFVPTTPASPGDLLAAMDRHGVEHTILVQPSAYGWDHRFLLETVRAHPNRFLPIGLVDPADAKGTLLALDLVRDAGCVGLRVNLSLDMARATDQAAGAGWPAIESLGVPVSLRATPLHDALVVRILERHPTTRFVIDHLGLPEAGDLAQASTRFSTFAAFEHCRIKVAGLASLSATGPPYRDAWPVVAEGLRLFGAARLVWGSDFPTADAMEGYGAVIGAMESMQFLDASDRRLMMATNAVELWGAPAAVPSR